MVVSVFGCWRGGYQGIEIAESKVKCQYVFGYMVIIVGHAVCWVDGQG